ncbi:hypothetical protein LTSEWAN_3689, partial [Salmonella enterica subsp. enterica serovar Wandsworth str. A4-580]
MQVHNAVALPLLVVRRGETKAPDPAGGQRDDA